MSKVPADTRAMRQMVVTGLVSFVVGFVGTAGGSCWMIVHFAEKNETWFTMGDLILHAIVYSFVFGGGGLAVICTSLLSWHHFRRGVYRCPHCGRTRKSIDDFCECPYVQSLKNGTDMPAPPKLTSR